MYCSNCGCEIVINTTQTQTTMGIIKDEPELTAVEVGNLISGINNKTENSAVLSFTRGLMTFYEKHGYLSQKQIKSLKSTYESLN